MSNESENANTSATEAQEAEARQEGQIREETEHLRLAGEGGCAESLLSFRGVRDSCG